MHILFDVNEHKCFFKVLILVNNLVDSARIFFLNNNNDPIKETNK